MSQTFSGVNIYSENKFYHLENGLHIYMKDLSTRIVSKKNNNDNLKLKKVKTLEKVCLWRKERGEVEGNSCFIDLSSLAMLDTHVMTYPFQIRKRGREEERWGSLLMTYPFPGGLFDPPVVSSMESVPTPANTERRREFVNNNIFPALVYRTSKIYCSFLFRNASIILELELEWTMHLFVLYTNTEKYHCQ